MKKKKVMLCVGTRPNFMKIAPIYEVLKKYKNITPIVVHTGQHHSKAMSKVFFDELKLPKPKIYLGVEHGTRIYEEGRIMEKFEPVLQKEKPDLVIVVGDVTSTFACADAAEDHLIPVAHVESGLRSYDTTMPEEINRELTDKISTYLFVTEKAGVVNLKKEGITKNVYFVGNVMIDTLLEHKKKAEKYNLLMKKYSLKKKGFVLVTLHRPSNVDSRKNLSNILDALNEINKKARVVFPEHPRTKKMAKKFGLSGKMEKLIVCPPLGYLEFLNAMMNCKFVVTDSGGIEEETTVLGIPCITLRKNTERPVTVKQGTNVLAGNSKSRILKEANKILDGKTKKGKVPEKWDGKAAQRIVNILRKKVLK